MALSVAAGWCGVDMDERQAHRALYDAHITAEILASLLSGDYREQRARLDASMAASAGATSVHRGEVRRQAPRAQATA